MVLMEILKKREGCKFEFTWRESQKVNGFNKAKPIIKEVRRGFLRGSR